MKYSVIAGQCLLLIAAAGSAAAFNLGGRGPLSSPSLSPSPSECLVFTGRPSPFSRTTLLFDRPKRSDEDMNERKKQLRILLSATDEEIEKLVRSNPGVFFRRDIVGAHGPKVTLLQERLGISEKEACKLCLEADRLLSYKLETLESKIDWLRVRLTLNQGQLWTFIKRAPKILCYSIEDNLEPSLADIQSSLDLSGKELTKMIVRTPGVLHHGLSADLLASRFLFLQDVLNIDEDDLESLRKVVMECPGLLVWSKEKMKEMMHWLKDRLGLDSAKIAQTCSNWPHVLTSKLTTLEEKVDWIQEALSLSDGELGKLFGTMPVLFGLSIKKNLAPRLEFLRLTFALDDEELKNLVTKQPGLFTMSEKDIEEKLHFYL